MEQIKKGDDLSQSKDIVQDNIAKLKELFPEVFTEGKIDFKILQDVLGAEIEFEEEFYRFTWAGKSQARREAHKASTGTLRPCKEESVNWDTSENLYLEGDNLEVLKLLQKSYYNKVKVIYIDPPYNTGNDFVYKDNYNDSLKNYQKITGQVDSEGNKLTTNSESDGRFHSNWLNMMYPRLKLARNLLSDDGVIFMSIDNNEIENLKKLSNEVFGEENFITDLVWEKKKKGTFLSNSITNIKEYILVYSKNKQSFDGLIGEINSEEATYPCINASNKRETRTIPAGIISNFKESDYFLKSGSRISVTTMDIILHSDLVIKDGVLHKELVLEGNWRYSQEKMHEYALAKELYVTQDLYLRRIVKEPRHKTLKDLLPRVGTNPDADFKQININNLFEDGWGSNEDGEEEIRLILEGKGIMDYPKPKKLIQKLLVSVRDSNAIILDFFSGSATTAHAAVELNLLDNGKRKFILVQLPAQTDIESETYKAGYKTIAEIGKERIRRISKKIALENPDKVKELDLGFKVFKLDSSNIKGWDGNPTNVLENLFDSQNNIKIDRSEDDVLFEILLKYGLNLTLPIQEKIIEGKKVFNVGYGALLICLADNITNKVAEGIGNWKNEINPETCRVIFKDTGFTDVEKTNAVQTLKRFGIHEIKSI